MRGASYSAHPKLRYRAARRFRESEYGTSDSRTSSASADRCSICRGLTSEVRGPPGEGRGSREGDRGQSAAGISLQRCGMVEVARVMVRMRMRRGQSRACLFDLSE